MTAIAALGFPIAAQLQKFRQHSYAAVKSLSEYGF
jgi:hypothetical protein